MINEHKMQFHPIIPGQKIPGDWYPGSIPANIVVGQDSVVESSFSFKHFFSIRPQALIIGNRVTLWRTSISLETDGEMEIGDDCYIANASLVCSRKIIIGSRVFIAGGVTIADSDFHPITPALRMADTIALSPVGDHTKRPVIKSKPVIIGDDVWIGFNATILKGITIGKGSIIEPGAMVVSNVREGETISGNPGKPILK